MNLQKYNFIIITFKNYKKVKKYETCTYKFIIKHTLRINLKNTHIKKKIISILYCIKNGGSFIDGVCTLMLWLWDLCRVEHGVANGVSNRHTEQAMVSYGIGLDKTFRIVVHMDLSKIVV